jgi:hypothetical protein
MKEKEIELSAVNKIMKENRRCSLSVKFMPLRSITGVYIKPTSKLLYDLQMNVIRSL